MERRHLNKFSISISIEGYLRFFFSVEMESGKGVSKLFKWGCLTTPEGKFVGPWFKKLFDGTVEICKIDTKNLLKLLKEF